jgi:hypothetical protein
VNYPPGKTEGVGNAGCPLHPQPRVQCVGSTRVSSPRSHRNTRHSRTRVVLTAYFVLSPATNSSCHRHRRIKVLSNPVGPTCLRQLDTSNGCQDHTALPSAKTLFVSEPFDRSRAISMNPPCHHVARPTLPRPPHPVPYVRDDRDTPLLGTGWRGL